MKYSSGNMPSTHSKVKSPLKDRPVLREPSVMIIRKIRYSSATRAKIKTSRTL